MMGNLIVSLAMIMGTGGAESTTVQIVGHVPDDTPPIASVYLAGGLTTLGNWQADGLAMSRRKDGAWVATFRAEIGTVVEFKFTLGSWQGVEKNGDGSELANRRIVVGEGNPKRDENGALIYKFTIARWASIETAADRNRRGNSRTSTHTGHIRLHENFKSSRLGNSRNIIVYLPPGYEDTVNSDKRYPVLYMHDGQNLFDAATSFLGVEWEADETADRLIKAGRIPPLIIVGIYNTPDRMSEYTPTRDANRNGGGKGGEYAAFVVEEVKPFIDRTYRTRPQREWTGVAGSSLGGLISLEIAVRYPKQFSRVGVISPALYWDEHQLIRRIEQSPGLVTGVDGEPLRIWLDMGTKEGSTLPTFERAVNDARRLANALRKAGLHDGRELKYVEVEGAVHNEAAWAKRMEEILLFLWNDAATPNEPSSRPR